MTQLLARLRVSLVITLACCAAPKPAVAPTAGSPAPAGEEQPARGDKLVVNRPLTIAFVATGSFFWLASDRLWHDQLAPTECRLICEPNGVNPFDRIFGRMLNWKNHDTPQIISDAASYVAVPLMVVGGLTLSSVVIEHQPENWLDDMLVVAETTVATGLVNRAVALGVARTRPRIRNLPPGEPVPPGDRQAYQSFFSGHDSEAFSLGISAAMVASIRHYRIAPWLWGGTIALGALIGWMRIAGEDHYVTDVLVGSAVGTAFGIIMPRLHRAKRGPKIEVAPQRDGATVGLAGSW